MVAMVDFPKLGHLLHWSFAISSNMIRNEAAVIHAIVLIDKKVIG